MITLSYLLYDSFIRVSFLAQKIFVTSV